MTDPALVYGWNAYSGRVYHHLTGERSQGTRRPLTVCGHTVRSGASTDRPPVGYAECRRCREILAWRASR